MEFSLSTYFNSFDVEKDYSIDISDIDSKLESVTNSLANNPESINFNPELLEDLIELTHGYRTLDLKHQKQLTYLVTSSLGTISHQCSNNIENGDFVDSIDVFKACLEKYGYLLFVLLIYLGKEDHGLAHISGSKSKSSSGSQALTKWKTNCTQVEDAIDVITGLVKIDLSKIFVTTPEKDLFIELFTRPMFHLMEVPERMKVNSIKLLMFKSIAILVKFHGHANVIQNSVLQCLMYYTHLPNYMAELLHMLDEQYDYNVLTEEVLREISQIEFNSNDSNGPKSISEFLIKLSELSPRLILKQMSCIAQLLDNSNQTLRCSVVETCGNIVVDIIKNQEANGQSSERNESHNSNQQIDGLLDLLQERFLDQNPYVRTKAIQALTKICNLPVKFTARRQQIVALSVRSLNDKSTLVRRNSIKLMSKLVLTHPFSAVHGTQLSYDFWKSKLDDAEAELEKYIPVAPEKNKKLNKISGDHDVIMEIDKGDEDEDEDDDEDENKDTDANNATDKEVNDSESSIDHDELNASMMEQEQNLPDTNVLVKTKLTVQYYQDAVEFIEILHNGTNIVSRLLFSKNRNEVLESMDFLVLADAYDIQNAGLGIRRMLHLVWMKGSSDEGKSISSHLVDCYRDLFLVAPSEYSLPQQAAHVAKNLIELTFAASVADLASLEKLLCFMYEEKLISQDVINVLWQIYSFADQSSQIDTPKFSKKQCRGAIIILGMLALADHEIVLRGLDALLNVGLGEKGRSDLVLSRYSCIALQRIVPHVSKNKKVVSFKIARENEAIEKLKEVLLSYSDNPEWYSVAEHAIGAVYQASSQPDDICSSIIKDKCILVFGEQIPNESKVIALSQLLFIVGHIAIKTIVHLEKLETQFKKKKHAAESSKNKETDNDDNENNDNELEMIGGTSEDDFTDAVVYIKERELLYGDSALLAKFGPLVREICSNNKRYDNESLQRSAVLCMAKLMCISSKYCEDNLPLLITIMEKSPDPIIRCNCVLGLGDMAVCFNNLVDENTDFLYRRLTDSNIMVQRTCLMTVTFLILAGQVKVKGQLSSMAKCLENPDQGISDMCRLFFTELATKDNAIYNGFIDIFSGLSNDDSLSKDAMKRIIKFLVGFIQKEKHQKQLTDKLLVRLLKCQNEAQWNDIAFVLNSIPYKNESISQALEGGYTLVLARQ